MNESESNAESDAEIDSGTDSEADERRTVKVSKYLSKHLRHQPEQIGLTLDEGAWVEIETLRAAAAAHGFRFTRTELDHVVATNNKRRFAIEGTRIPGQPGPFRRGGPRSAPGDAAAMHRDGHSFRVSANGVWLTTAVPPRYLRFPEPH